MLSAPSRAAVRAETLAHLATFGIVPHVLTNDHDEPESHGSHGILGWRAITWAMRTDPTQPVLWLEDDVTLHVRITDFLPRILASGKLVTLYSPSLRYTDRAGTVVTPPRVHLRKFPPRLADRVMRQEPSPFELFVQADLRNHWGSLAYVFPAAFCADLLDAPYEPGQGYDTIVRHTATLRAWPIYEAFPNLAQHRHDIASVSVPASPRHASATFDIPITDERATDEVRDETRHAVAP